MQRASIIILGQKASRDASDDLEVEAGDRTSLAGNSLPLQGLGAPKLLTPFQLYDEELYMKSLFNPQEGKLRSLKRCLLLPALTKRPNSSLLKPLLPPQRSSATFIYYI